VIPEPQRTYVLELLAALGPAAEEFVIAGAQAIKFVVQNARATKDVDFRVDVQQGVHARACTGASIALAESDEYLLEGRLPNGNLQTARVRVTRPNALVMLKLLALYDRYHNIRGPQEARHDREEAQTHAADIVAIVKARPDVGEFKPQFEGQFVRDTEFGRRVWEILKDFFREETAPGYLLYEESLAAALPAGGAAQAFLQEESARAHRILQRILLGL